METIGDILGRKDLIKFGELPSRQWEPKFICGDNGKLRGHGWRPQFGLRPGLEDTNSMVAKRINAVFRKYFNTIVIFFYPLILVLINSNWIFTPASLSPDPWFYFAYFRYFNDYALSFPSNAHYFVERLTWDVPGYYINKIFQPELANYIIHLLVYYVAVFSLYGILKILFNRRSALISALLMGSYPWFLRAVGWDYVDGVESHNYCSCSICWLFQYVLRIGS